MQQNPQTIIITRQESYLSKTAMVKEWSIKPADLLKYEEKVGLGACCPVAMVLRDLGAGEIEVGQFGLKRNYERSFPHYWIRTKDNKIIDLTNPHLDKKGWTYWDIEKIPHSEHPSPGLYTQSDYNFWKNKIIEITVKLH